MQEFDQEIAPPLGVSQQGADLGLRRWLDLPALGTVRPRRRLEPGWRGCCAGACPSGTENSDCLYCSMICGVHRPGNKGVASYDRENLSNVPARGQYYY
jgi:hypothetical protein